MKLYQYVFVFLFSLFLQTTCYGANNNNTKINKQNVIAFYNAAFNQLNFAEAAKYLGPQYIQHSPHVADGSEGLKALIQTLHDKFPKTHVDIKRVFADGNYVFLQVNFVTQPGIRGLAIMDLFKLKNGKIIEHWGVSQEVPEKSLNSNGMF